jgi:hypothetical protein
VPRMMMIVIVAAALLTPASGFSQPPQQPAAPTTPAPQTPGTPQPPRTQPPPEQVPAPTPTPAQPPTAGEPQPNPPMTQPTGAQPPAVAATDIDHRTALMLLDRMQALVEAALTGKKPTKKSESGGAVGTSGTMTNESASSGIAGSGKVTIDRASLDEILAEIAQIKTTLQR